MDPCLDAEEMREIDRWAINERGVPSLELMETAGRAVADAAAETAGSSRAAVICGKGNNGGDGLVAARALTGMGFEVDALLLAPPEELSGDARANLERFGGARHVDPGDIPAAIDGAGVIIDAIFGTGFAGTPGIRPRRRSRQRTRRPRRWSPRTSPRESTPRPGRSRERRWRPISR